MSEIHFRLNLWPFQIDTQLYFFYFFLTKWLPSAILEVRNSLSITFLAILDQYGFVLFFFEIFYKMAASGHFVCSKITLDCISGNFRSIGPFWMSEIHFRYSNSGHFRRPFWMCQNHFRLHFWPFLIDRPFWMSEIHFRWHFWPFQIHTDLNFCLTKWPPAAILDVRK